MTSQTTIIIATILGTLAIILGAFGAHFLKKRLTEDQQKSFETGVKYQMYHAIVLLVLGLNFNPDFSNAVYFFTIGILFFSFSIYGLVLSDAFAKKLRFLGPVTPIGGLLLTIGWILLLVSQV